MFDKWIKNADDQIIGFSCPYHGSKVLYPGGAAFANTDDLLCPACGQPICPECANMFETKPAESSEALDYFIGSQNGRAHAYCGQCGDYGYEYTLKYLRLVGCELPRNHEDYKEPPTEFTVVTTQRIAALPDLQKIAKKISDLFASGQRGIIRHAHDKGEIWGIPEKHPDGWIVTICYPEER